MLGWCVVAVPYVIGAVLGVIGWWMGQTDLAKIKAGSMDPEGEGQTQGGWICSIIGTALNVLGVLSCGGWILFNVLQDMERNRAQQPAGFQKNNPGKLIDDKPRKEVRLRFPTASGAPLAFFRGVFVSSAIAAARKIPATSLPWPACALRGSS